MQRNAWREDQLEGLGFDPAGSRRQSQYLDPENVDQRNQLDNYTPSQLASALVPSARDIKRIMGPKKAIVLIRALTVTAGNKDGDLTIELNWPPSQSNPLGKWTLECAAANGASRPYTGLESAQVEVFYTVPRTSDPRAEAAVAASILQPGFRIKAVSTLTQQEITMTVVRPEKLAPMTRRRSGSIMVTGISVSADKVADPAKYVKTQSARNPKWTPRKKVIIGADGKPQEQKPTGKMPDAYKNTQSARKPHKGMPTMIL